MHPYHQRVVPAVGQQIQLPDRALVQPEVAAVLDRETAHPEAVLAEGQNHPALLIFRDMASQLNEPLLDWEWLYYRDE